MHFDEHVQFEAGRELVQVPKAIGLEHRRNQKNRTRAGRPRLVYLVRVEYKIFSQHRQAAGFANLADPTEIALKKIFFSDNRNSGGSSTRIDRRERNNVEVLPKYSLRGRCLLYFRDQADALLIAQ